MKLILPLLTILSILTYLKEYTSDRHYNQTIYNPKVRQIAQDLLSQCIPDIKSRRLPVYLCYQSHDKYLRDNLR